MLASRSRKPKKQHRFLRGQIAHDAVLDYADLYSVTLHDDNVQEFDSRWNEVLLSMTKIPSDEIWESLYKLRYVSLINDSLKDIGS